MSDRVKLGPVLCVNCARKVGWWLVDGKWVLRNLVGPEAPTSVRHE